VQPVRPGQPEPQELPAVPELLVQRVQPEPQVRPEVPVQPEPRARPEVPAQQGPRVPVAQLEPRV
jgi:hypothetical protein